MKQYVSFIFLLISTLAQCQDKIKVYYEQIENGLNIYADNNEVCPVSIKIDFKLKNLEVEGGNHEIYVANPQDKKQLLTSISVVKKGKDYKFSFQYSANFGDHFQDEYDENYIYDLPFKASNEFEIFQGYMGTFSHQNENALDFTMPIGTEITAIRSGVVVKVIDKNSKSCAKEKCKKYNNLILIYHKDGTFAEYAHIKKNGSEVKVGEEVSKGQLIGYSGNVGFSSGPHLHLVVFQQKLENRETLKTKFRVGDGSQIEYLTEKREYSRDY